MQGLQVDIFGQQLQIHISLQLNVLSMSARSVALPLFSLASRTNAGCSLLEVYPMRFQMALCFICNICTHHLNTLALPFLSIVETENNRATYLCCTVPWDVQITRSQHVIDDDQQHHDGQWQHSAARHVMQLRDCTPPLVLSPLLRSCLNQSLCGCFSFMIT